LAEKPGFELYEIGKIRKITVKKCSVFNGFLKQAKNRVKGKKFCKGKK